jgi:hypothetical protein
MASEPRGWMEEAVNAGVEKSGVPRLAVGAIVR